MNSYVLRNISTIITSIQSELPDATISLDSITGQDICQNHDLTLDYTVYNINSNDTLLNIDKFHLTTAINNVLENAVKYGCNNITISTKNENGHFQISIQDDGIGISKQKQHLLFEKFYRVEQGNLHNTKGLGLGLYYVDQIVKAHKGSVNVMSELGKGASFTISLPTA